MQSELKITAGKHIPQLDGLRGIAILMVICYHFFPYNIICDFGWSGVDLFFVLSGFLITSRLAPYINDKKILPKFYRNRFLRIVPLYFVFLILFFLGWFLLSSKATLDSTKFYSSHWWQFFLFIQNWVFANNPTEVKTYLQHLWSVAVEEQIYLVFPLLLIYLKNKKRLFYTIIFILIVIVLSRCYYYNFILLKTGYLKIFCNTFFRFDSFLCGVIAYFIYINSVNFNKTILLIKWIGLFCFFVLLTYFTITKNSGNNSSFIANGGYTIIALMYASLLLTALSKKNKLINTITLFSFLRYTGKISYGLYIFHWPLYLVGFIIINKISAYFNNFLSYTTLHIVNALVCIPITYLICYLSFKYYESYFLKRKIH